MEIWDLYDRDGKKTGETWERQWGNFRTIPEGRYHLVVDILVQHVDGTFLLTKRHESKDVYPGYWEASAGGSAVSGEEPLVAAKREMKEETGLESDDFTLVNVSFRDPSHSMFYSYLAVVDCDKDSVVLQEGETVEYKWVDKAGLIEYSESPLSIKTHNYRYGFLFDEYRNDLNGLNSNESESQGNASQNTGASLGNKSQKVLLFDLDGTLLRTDKTISTKTLEALLNIRRKGYMIGVSTSRSENNSRSFINNISPDFIISSGGAMITVKGEIVVLEEITGDKTAEIIAKAREVCGDIAISADTAGEKAEYYRNFIPPQDELEKSWGESIDTDFKDFRKPTLKLCFEIHDEEKAEQFRNELTDSDFIRFSDGEWYKVTKAGITKETAIEKLCAHLGISLEQVTAFGDDFADMGMLKMCGTGVAMGNAVPEVKAVADITIGTNDEDGIADYLGTL